MERDEMSNWLEEDHGSDISEEQMKITDAAFAAFSDVINGYVNRHGTKAILALIQALFDNSAYLLVNLEPSARATFIDHLAGNLTQMVAEIESSDELTVQ